MLLLPRSNQFQVSPVLQCRSSRFELADGDWMTSSLPKNSEAGDAKLDGRVRSPVGAVAQGNSTSPGPHGTREARSAEPSGAFSGLQLTADETPNENPAPRRRTGGGPAAPRPGGLIPFKGLGSIETIRGTFGSFQPNSDSRLLGCREDLITNSHQRG